MTDDEIYELAQEVAREFFDIYFAVPPSRETVIEFGRKMFQRGASWQAFMLSK